jgi:hypothetical protein
MSKFPEEKDRERSQLSSQRMGENMHGKRKPTLLRIQVLIHGTEARTELAMSGSFSRLEDKDELH